MRWRQFILPAIVPPLLLAAVVFGPSIANPDAQESTSHRLWRQGKCQVAEPTDAELTTMARQHHNKLVAAAGLTERARLAKGITMTEVSKRLDARGIELVSDLDFAHDDAAEDDSAIWDNELTGDRKRLYEWETVQMVRHTPHPCYATPDDYAYKTWTEVRRYNPTTGETVRNYANYDFFNAQLQLKACSPADVCTTQAPWGSVDFECNSCLTKVFQGSNHALSNEGDFSVRARNLHMQARFLTGYQGGSVHLTLVYDGCSRWTSTYRSGSLYGEKAESCVGMAPV